MKKEIASLQPWQTEQNEHDISTLEVKVQLPDKKVQKNSFQHISSNRQLEKKKIGETQINKIQSVRQDKILQNKRLLLFKGNKKSKSLRNIIGSYHHYPTAVCKIQNQDTFSTKDIVPYLRNKVKESHRQQLRSRKKRHNQRQKVNKTENDTKKDDQIKKNIFVGSRKKMMKMGTYNINEHFYVKDRKREISDKINDIKNSFLNTKLEKEEMGISAKDIMDEKDDMEIKSKRNYIFENKKIEDSMKNSVITSKTEFLLDKKGNSPENRIFDYHERWTVSLKKRFLVNRQIHEIKKYKINDKMFY